MNTFVRVVGSLFVVLIALVARPSEGAQTTAFTYQGQLLATGGGLVNDPALTVTFALYDASSNGALVSVPTGMNPVSTSGAVVDGLFTRSVDFGLIFDGTNQYWVEVAVVDGSGTHVLAPRTQITTAPVAQYALRGGSITGIAAGGDLTGTYPNPTIANGKVTLAKHAGVDFTGTLGGVTVPASSCANLAIPLGGVNVGDQIVMTFTGTQPTAGLVVYASGTPIVNQFQVNFCNVTTSSKVEPPLPIRITTWR
jgi:hypothetical protein